MKYPFISSGFKVVLAVPILLMLAPRVEAQFTQQGSKLVGAGAVNTPYQAMQGQSVALSSDGNTAIIGGLNDSSFAGAAWVWTRSGGVWAQQGRKLVGSGAVPVANQGSSVALSSDGNTAIVGGSTDNSQIGAVWVWTRSGGVWTQQGGKLVGTSAYGTSGQGSSVALSSDGNTAIVGGEGDSVSRGAAWVWTRSGGVWTQQGSKLVGSGAVYNSYGPYISQGHSVALSSDGNTAIIGGYGDNSHLGAAWVWTRSGGVWSQQGSKLIGTGAVNGSYGAYQGFSVSLSADGNTAMVGGEGDNGYVGAVWVWTRSGGIWTQQGSKLVGTGAVSTPVNQGNSVSLSADGNTAIVGGERDNSDRGAAWVWTRSGGVWTQLGSKLVGTGAVVVGTNTAEQGHQVSLSADGNTAIVGGFHDSNTAGAAWVFTRNGTPVLPQIFELRRLNLENGKLLRFDLPQKSHVVIQLFNSQGRMVSQLLDETRDAGYYSVPLTSEAQGSYYLDFRAGDFHRTMKIRP